tara:strand:+ start:69 stop:404 length:336 start_codon:yes stop_codon:yes gene_type:complete
MIIAEKQNIEDSLINNVVKPEGPLKEMLVNYTGRKYKGELNRFNLENDKQLEWNGEVTVEMIVETLADEFPEFVMAVAEENFIRGYRQAFTDMETGMEIAESQAKNNESPR